jgi:hypothetical protein
MDSPLFSDHRFLAWKAAFNAAMCNIADPVRKRLEESTPALAAHLQAAHSGSHDFLKRLEINTRNTRNISEHP